jgi:hypothetical protein
MKHAAKKLTGSTSVWLQQGCKKDKYRCARCTIAERQAQLCEIIPFGGALSCIKEAACNFCPTDVTNGWMWPSTHP